MFQAHAGQGGSSGQSNYRGGSGNRRSQGFSGSSNRPRFSGNRGGSDHSASKLSSRSGAGFSSNRSASSGGYSSTPRSAPSRGYEGSRPSTGYGSKPSGASRPYSGARPAYGSRSSFSGGSRSGGRPSFGGRGGGGGGRGRGMRGERIDPARFIYTPDPTKQTPSQAYVSTNTFADFGLCKELTGHITARGFTNPTAIQDQVIAHAMKGKDIIGLAATGSGKTAAFLIPCIEKVYQDRSQKVLILAPTRELAQQINKEMRELSHGMHLFSTVCVGGTPMYRQIQDVKRANQFIIATPGRLKDLAKRKYINLATFGTIVLDEVDRMLDMGFVVEITEVLKQLPPDRQSLFFSATMPPKIKTLVNTFLKDPVTVDLGSGNSTKNVAQNVVRTKGPDDKFAKLCEILRQPEVTRTIIFTDMKSSVDRLGKALATEGFSVGVIHGDKVQRQRERTLRDFKEGVTKILIATDVAARGIDVNDVTHVINYTVPQTHDDYVHRIGRTGRANKTGVALTFI